MANKNSSCCQSSKFSKCFCCCNAKSIENIPYSSGTKPLSVSEVKIEANSDLHHSKSFYKKIHIASNSNSGTSNGSHSSINEIPSKKFTRLIIRRGEPFFINIQFDRTIVPYDEIKLQFDLTDETIPDVKTHVSSGTRAFLPIDLTCEREFDEEEKWDGTRLLKHKITESFGITNLNPTNHLYCKIKSPASCPIGKWNLTVTTSLKGDETKVNKELFSQNELFVLFNPWNKNDAVYHESKEALEEYVLEENGIIWKGNSDSHRGSQWLYGQFDKHVLEVVFYLISLKGPTPIPMQFRGDPIKIVRALTASVNSNDDNGILSGNWSGDYKSGTSPLEWTGSSKILKKYNSTKQPVKYGQCWVFGGVLTTICRAIGIPCRTVTNFESAHDTEKSLTIDFYVNEKGESIDNMNRDSVWNFHVWNEVWMTRPDLKGLHMPRPNSENESIYSGWQVVDATPQEKSQGTFCLGPTSVQAIKLGEIHLPFDGEFVFGEVNADRATWLCKNINSPRKLIGMDSNSVGQFISTKAIGNSNREDLTICYKYPEDSTEERKLFIKALKKVKSQIAAEYLDNLKDIEIHIETAVLNEKPQNFDASINPKFGDNFFILAKIQNTNEVISHEVDIEIRAEAATYSNHSKDLIDTTSKNLRIEPKQIQEIKMELTYKKYKKKLLNDRNLRVSCLAKVTGHIESFAQRDLFLDKPNINFKVNNGLVEVTLKNPLSVALTNACFHVESTGTGKPFKIKSGKIGPGKVQSETIKLVSKGLITINVKFTSNELSDIEGSINVTN